jgi:NAD(P)H-hydrate epimerase
MIRLTRAQVREIDRRAVQQYKIPGVVLMENAARAATDVALEMLGSSSGPVVILCGGGNNGGDGLAVARHLHNHGIDIKIVLTADSTKYQGEALVNWEIVKAMGLPAIDLAAAGRPALILDAIFGTGLTQAPREPFGGIVQSVAAMNAPVMAIDIPSGMDCDTGRPLGNCIAATRTITFVAEKIGFAQPEAAKYLGRVTVGDIGCPHELIQEVYSANIASP